MHSNRQSPIYIAYLCVYIATLTHCATLDTGAIALCLCLQSGLRTPSSCAPVPPLPHVHHCNLTPSARVNTHPSVLRPRSHGAGEGKGAGQVRRCLYYFWLYQTLCIVYYTVLLFIIYLFVLCIVSPCLKYINNKSIINILKLVRNMFKIYYSLALHMLCIRLKHPSNVLRTCLLCASHVLRTYFSRASHLLLTCFRGTCCML